MTFLFPEQLQTDPRSRLGLPSRFPELVLRCLVAGKWFQVVIYLGLYDINVPSRQATLAPA